MYRGRAARTKSSPILQMSITTGGKAEVSFRHDLSRVYDVWMLMGFTGALGMIAHQHRGSVGRPEAIARQSGFCTATVVVATHSVGLDPIAAVT